MLFRTGVDKHVSYPVACGDRVLEGKLHHGLDVLRRVVPVEHEHRYEVLYPRCVPLLLPEPCEELLEARRPLFTPPADDKGAVEGAGLASYQFQVMLGIELPLVVPEEPLVVCYPPAVMEDVDPVDGQLYPDL